MNLSTPAIFLAGLLTFASPCVLPLIPVYLATIAGGSLAEVRARRTLLVASAFVLGLGSVFIALGALASSVGAVLVAHRTAITIASGALMVLFGARALGLLRLPSLDRDARPGLMRVRNVSSVAGAFLFGSAFALGWSPCIGPVLAAVLSYAAAHAETPARGALLLAVYAAGLALPLLACAVGAGHASAWIQRARVAIPRLEKLTGVALAAVGIWTLAGALPNAQQLAADGVGQAACAIAGAGHTCALPSGVTRPGPQLELNATGAKFLEFTSNECPVCRRMRPVIERLAATCSELDTSRVLVDVTTASGRALADQHHVRGTPTFVLLDEHGVERARLLGENSREELAAAVERAFGVSCWS